MKRLVAKIVSTIKGEPVIVWGIIGVLAAAAAVYYKHPDYIAFIVPVIGMFVRNRVTPADRAVIDQVATVIEKVDPAATAAIESVQTATGV
jgi:hypothetical protein